jgi:hypothetical protein
MSTLETVAIFGFIGLACSIAALAALWWMTALWGKEVWRRLRRSYHLTVILYWLDRLEKGGTRVFQKAEQEDRTP